MVALCVVSLPEASNPETPSAVMGTPTPPLPGQHSEQVALRSHDPSLALRHFDALGERAEMVAAAADEAFRPSILSHLPLVTASGCHRNFVAVVSLGQVDRHAHPITHGRAQHARSLGRHCEISRVLQVPNAASR